MSNDFLKEWEMIAAERAQLEYLQSHVEKWEKKFVEKHRAIADGAIVKTKSTFGKKEAPKAKVISARFDCKTGQILYTIVEQWRAEIWEFGESLLVEVVE